MNLSKSGLVVVLGTLLTIAAPGHAATFEALYTGSMSSGLDVTGGVFGLPGGTDLTNYAFSLSVLYDTAAPGRTTTATSDKIVSGAIQSQASGVITATLTINGVSQVIVDNTDATVSADNDGVSNSKREASVLDSFDNGLQSYGRIAYMTVQGDQTLFQAQLGAPLTATLLDGALFAGQFSLRGDDNIFIPGDTYFSYGIFDATALTVAAVGVTPVPLPASFGLMAGAVLGLGSLRLKKRAA
jgi:hypothetical protein